MKVNHNQFYEKNLPVHNFIVIPTKRFQTVRFARRDVSQYNNLDKDICYIYNKSDKNITILRGIEKDNI